jgi:hypothetical protein
VLRGDLSAGALLTRNAHPGGVSGSNEFHRQKTVALETACAAPYMAANV